MIHHMKMNKTFRTQQYKIGLILFNNNIYLDVG